MVCFTQTIDQSVHYESIEPHSWVGFPICCCPNAVSLRRNENNAVRGWKRVMTYDVSKTVTNGVA